VPVSVKRLVFRVGKASRLTPGKNQPALLCESKPSKPEQFADRGVRRDALPTTEAK
jgi:hypothetical protein